MTSKIKIGVIIGSTRQKRFSDKPAKWILELAKQNPEVEAELIDLRDYPLPFYDEALTPSRIEKYSNETANKWLSKIKEMDAFIIASPEYNHGAPGVLKNALDYAYSQWNNKPIGFVSWGSVGGGRVIEQLRLISVELQMAPIRNSINIPMFYTLIDANGELKAGALDPLKDNAAKFLEQLLWWAKALKAARK